MAAYVGKEFLVPLTQTQIHGLREAWLKEGKQGGAILAQPILAWGPFELKDCPLACVIIDNNLKRIIDSLIKKERPDEALMLESFGESVREKSYLRRERELLRIIKSLEAKLRGKNEKAKSKPMPSKAARPKKRRA
jgi:hypothetical protein